MPGKYSKGRQLTSIHEVIDIILDGRPIYWQHKVQTQGWMVSQRLNTLTATTNRGWFFEAIPNTEEE